jgi:hypothetical protein
MAVLGLMTSETLIFVPPIVSALVRAEFAWFLFWNLNDNASAAGAYSRVFSYPEHFNGFIRQAMPGAVGLHGAFP